MYRLLCRDEPPSFGAFLRLGLNTWPELWSVSDRYEGSRIHTCYTGVSGFLMQGLAGIRLQPGCPGEVLLALKVRELAAAGLPFHEVVSQAAAFCGGMHTLFVLESLENLRKNGRLTGLQSVVTAALRIKLLMGSTPQGEICKKGQAMSMKQALGKMVELMAKDPDHVGKLLVLSHCNCLERAFQLREMAQKSCRFSEVFICETGGISTVYANDGGIVAAY